MATHRAPKRKHGDPAPPHLAYTALVLAIVGLIGAFWPGVNQITGVLAAIGIAAGFAGVWMSRQILSGVAVVLCGTAVMLTWLSIAVHDARSERQADMEFHLELPLVETAATQGVSGGC